jgi:hypothetical protein
MRAARRMDEEGAIDVLRPEAEQVLLVGARCHRLVRHRAAVLRVGEAPRLDELCLPDGRAEQWADQGRAGPTGHEVRDEEPRPLVGGGVLRRDRAK